MDGTLLCTDDRTRSSSSVAEKSDLCALSVSHGPPEQIFAARGTGTEAVSHPSETSAEPPSNISNRLPWGKSAVSGCSKPSTSSYTVRERLSFRAESGQKDEDLKVTASFDSCHFSPSSEINSEQEGPRSARENAGSQPFETKQSASDVAVGESGVDESCCGSEAAFPLLPRHPGRFGDSKREPVPELYIFESETRDFILSSSLDPQETRSMSLLQMTEREADGESDPCIHDSAEVLRRPPGWIEEWVTAGASQGAGLSPPAADGCETGAVSVNDARQEKEVNGLNSRARGDSPVELWLDARQYLTGEERDNQDILDGTAHFVTQEGRSVPSEESGYSPEGTNGIGRSRDDTKGWRPRVERWSSSDSWESALSDWTAILAAPPEDITAAFTEIGAEIDALTQALTEANTFVDTERSTEGRREEKPAQISTMGVQDQPLEAQTIPETMILPGRSCLSSRPEAAPPDVGGGERFRSSYDSSATAREEKDPEGTRGSPAVNPPQPTSTAAPVGESQLALGRRPHVDLDVESLDDDIFLCGGEDHIVLNITEDTDSEERRAPSEPILQQPAKDGVREVTGKRGVLELAKAAEPEAYQDREAAKVDDDETAAEPSFLAEQTLRSRHVPGLDTKPSLRVDVDPQVPSDTSAEPDRVCQVEPQWGGPKFIMPVAPLASSSSLNCRKGQNLEDGQFLRGKSLNGKNISHDHTPAFQFWPVSDADNRADKDTIGGFSSEEPPSRGAGEGKATNKEIGDLGRELSNLTRPSEDHFQVSEKDRVAFITLDFNDPFLPRSVKPDAARPEREDANRENAENMPHKTQKITTDGKTLPKKEKSAAHHLAAQASKKQEASAGPQPCVQKETLVDKTQTVQNTGAVTEEKKDKMVIETVAVAEKPKTQRKKKKKQGQNAAVAKTSAEPPVEGENEAKPQTAKGRIDMFEAKLCPKVGKTQRDACLTEEAEKKKKKKQPEVKPAQGEKPLCRAEKKDDPSKTSGKPPKDDVIKRRRLSEDKFGKFLESKQPKPGVSNQEKAELPKTADGATQGKPYSEVVKQKAVPPKEDPKVVRPIQAASVSGDPGSLCLWCQFSAVPDDHTVTWKRDGGVLTEIKRSAGDESRVSLTISNASHKDLGKYQCCYGSQNGSLTLDYLLTYEVLSEIVIPQTPKTIPSAPVEVGTEEEDVQCSRLLFEDDFLSGQYFGEKHPVSIVTEKAHFGEGMHRRAFRTKLQAGRVPLLLPGHACVLKVHNAVSYGTKNNDELIQKNFTLATEECQVQNTAREYIKQYSDAVQHFEAFGEVPEIIPIYLVHRPSSDIPYATLEEELIGDFVKYSVKDGKEINLMRRDSEAGRKCCAFQHWVYHETDGNLLITDMQGVGMRLTDVGIATCKKGYKGFKGNCSTSFIEQFKALHQCNNYCEILGLKSLQPKLKKPASLSKARPQPSGGPKKKSVGLPTKGKS